MNAVVRIAILIAAVSATAAQAQTLVGPQAVTYGTSTDLHGYALARSGNSLFITGQSADFSSILMKVARAPGFVRLWTVNWPSFNAGPRHESMFGVATTPEDAYIAGWSYSQTTDGVGDKEGKSILMKYPLDGAIGPDTAGALWVQKPHFYDYRGVEFYGAVGTSTEGGQTYLYAAALAQENSDNQTILLTKSDTAGNLIWTKPLSTTASGTYGSPKGITVLNDGIYVVGQLSSSAGTQHSVLYRVARSGTVMWTNTYAPAGLKSVGQSACSHSHTIYVGGYTKNPSDVSDGYIQAIDELGHTLWTKPVNGALSNTINGIATNGTLLASVGATLDSTKPGNDAFVVLNDLTGNRLTTATYRGTGDDEANAVVFSGDRDTIFVLGDSTSFNILNPGKRQVLLLSYDVH